MTLPLGFLDFLGPAEMLIIGIVAILLFGERLPEVARSWGKKFVEVKKSVQGIREEFEAATRDVTSTVSQSVGLPAGRSHASHRVERRGAGGGDGPEVRASAERIGRRDSLKAGGRSSDRIGRRVFCLGAHSSVGRAPSSQGGSHRFESCCAHSPTSKTREIPCFPGVSSVEQVALDGIGAGWRCAFRCALGVSAAF